MTVTEAVDSLPRRLAGWAAAQSLPPNSMTGISLALGLCAAVWFTAGTWLGNAAGAVALCGSYLVGRSARRLAATPPGRGRARPAKGTTASETAGSARANAGSASRLAKPGSAERMSAKGTTASETAGSARANAGSASRLAKPGSTERIAVSEPAARARPNAVRGSQLGHARLAGGMTAGELATRANTGSASRLARANAGSAGRLARACAATTECGAYAGLAAGGPVTGGLLARGLVTGGPLAGAGMWQLATTAVIMVAVSQLAVACGSQGRAGSQGPAGGRGPAGSPRDASPRSLSWQVLGMPYGGRILLIAVVAPVVGARGAFLGLLGWAVIAIGYAIISSRSRPAGARAARAIVVCRDDGLIATEIGQPVRGQLVPLPPALTGVAAVAVLAVLGLRNLPGFLLLAPVVAMLLAAVGSSHPHVGRLDWVVPVLLQAGQFGYIAAIGAATAVPAPLIFTACALTALHYAHLAGHATNDSAVGWEGRMIAAGLGAALGMATFTYLLLAAYLGVLICREFMTNWLPATEGDRR